MDRHGISWIPILALCFLVTGAHPSPVQAGLSASLYGIHMDPADQDAKNYSAASYGGGVRGSFSIPQVGNLIAGSFGLEIINMLSETHAFQDPVTGLRVEQQTSQQYFRLYLGPEIGPHGNGFLRPHVGAHVAFITYDISTDVVIPNDAHPENEIRQNQRSVEHTAFGYDLNAGTDLNFGKWYIEGGGRFAKSFNVPQQLGEGAVSIHPGYVQIYMGLGMNFQY